MQQSDESDSGSDTQESQHHRKSSWKPEVEVAEYATEGELGTIWIYTGVFTHICNKAVIAILDRAGNQHH
jgi:hypothetical protein